MINVKDGVLYRDGKPFVFISADYPYYRDYPENWSDRLDKLKEAGIEVVTFYVPWRHHHLKIDGKDVIDFSGETQGNRDVLSFIKLVEEKEMFAVVKPGPFIHAETDFGGLPDFVEGGKEFEAMLDNEGNERKWHKNLPAAFDAAFTNAVQDWYKVCDETVIKPFTYPAGPVIALQILNEGLYSDGQHSVLAYDYSPSGLEYHAERLQKQFGSIDKYNDMFGSSYTSYQDIPVPRSFDIHTKENVKEILPYLHWAETQNRYLGDLYTNWGSAIDSTLPVFNNINPPLNEAKGFDFWLTRVVPEHWDVSYGFTNWIGVVSHDETAFLRYLLLVKRDRGINLEENWGFSDPLYDWRYIYHHVPFYQTVLAMGLGATGFNVYTGISTDGWTDELDSIHARPYPDCSPISEKGETGEKYEALKVLVSYLKENEQLITEGKRGHENAWGLYAPYSYLASFGIEDRDFEKLGVKAPHSGYKAMESFMLTMLKEQREFGIVNIEAASLEELQQQGAISIVGGFFMHRAVQEKLLQYVNNGGKLFFFGEVPQYDEAMDKCDILASVITDSKRYNTVEHGDGIVVYYPENPFSSCGISPTFAHLMNIHIDKSRVVGDECYTFLYELDGKKSLYVLSNSQIEKEHNLSIDGEQISISLPAKGCAIITLTSEEITSCVVKGINDYDESFVTPAVSYRGQTVKADAPCDFYYSKHSNISSQVNKKG
ncbi:beta-galactosidase [Cytobacillus sp. IB215316]|uniref:beta-galactosidase n=1 Tax=Cytobacillus sp. IB215316 TaxID=3097354 RepID=UPI002A14A3B1|nr:beta-galactosidase [Cytobacillus sp. IB215316]MDX8360276.1 beta-galactosidase [Cytobacillus sp. IB215316]